MQRALELAGKAYDLDEIPVGSLIVKQGQIIAEAYNLNRSEKNATRHAEIIAIEKASFRLQNERLSSCDLYVTKEPCAMCAGAIVHGRLDRVIIGTRDKKYGACGTVLDICGNPLLNHRPEIIIGILEEECAAILKKFFAERR